jgi:hypothetical protein
MIRKKMLRYMPDDNLLQHSSISTNSPANYQIWARASRMNKKPVYVVLYSIYRKRKSDTQIQRELDFFLFGGKDLFGGNCAGRGDSLGASARPFPEFFSGLL